MNIALIAPPWPLFNRPSIQLACLKAYISKEAPLKNVQVKVFHPYLQLASELGYETYNLISQSSWASEAVCAAIFFPENCEAAQKLFETSLDIKQKRRLQENSDKQLESKIKNFTDVVHSTQKVLEVFLLTNDWSNYNLIGLTASVNQLTAALFLADSIKRRYPMVKTVLGGAGCAGKTGKSLLENFPFLDFVVNGEGELPFYELVQHVSDPEQYLVPSGIFSRAQTSLIAQSVHKSQLKALEELPMPDFDDFFKELSQLPANKRFYPVLPIESSRGCWWGRCAFCNLNLQWKGYRAKSPEKMAFEIEKLSKRYNCIDFAFMDNALPRKTAKKCFESLKTHQKDYTFFAELRAVHSRQELELMANAGLKDVQVGIEALSGSLLKRLNKGVSLMANVAAMRHASEYNLNLMGNLILHFPTSTEEEAQETLQVLDFVWPYAPLQPVSFWLGMESPVCKNATDYNVISPMSHKNWKAIFPPTLLKKLELMILDYKGDRQKQKIIWKKVYDRLMLWQKQRKTLGFSTKLLTFRAGGDFITIKQVIPSGQTMFHRLSGTSRSIYLSCLEPVEIEQLSDKFNNFSKEQILTFIKAMEAKKLMFMHDNKVLSLAIHKLC